MPKPSISIGPTPDKPDLPHQFPAEPKGKASTQPEGGKRPPKGKPASELPDPTKRPLPQR
jgi:hypothetical protein